MKLIQGSEKICGKQENASRRNTLQEAGNERSFSRLKIACKPKLPTDVLTSKAKCQQYVSDSTITGNRNSLLSFVHNEVNQEDGEKERFFDPVIPKYFRAMSAAALRSFIVRHERISVINGKKVSWEFSVV